MGVAVKHPTTSELEVGLDDVIRSPKDRGVLEMIVRRPSVGEREILDEGQLDLVDGLVGDSWKIRSSKRTADGTPHPDMQLNLINSRLAALVSQDRSRWHLAGDQLYVDLDLGAANLPPGTRLSIGSAVIEVTAEPHLGCAKFVERFGLEAMQFVNDKNRSALNLRGINARVVESGAVRVGDTVSKL
jgi:MOSC domain-containing protein